MKKAMEKKDALISVIIPVYNVEPWLAECLNSVVGQTFRDLEIICVNDGSTDGSLTILQSYAERDQRIRIISQENSGLSEARNTGIRYANGKYLYFLDSDDFLKEDAMELCMHKMEAQGLEFLCFNAAAFGEDTESAKEAGVKNHQDYKRNLDESRVYSGVELYKEHRQGKQYIAPVWSCVLVRSVLLENNLWFHPHILHEDEPWMFSAMLSAKRCGCINKILYLRRIREGSITKQQPTFNRVYGKFVGSQDMQRWLENYVIQFPDPDLVEIGTAHILARQRAAVNDYRRCSEDEKQKRNNLPAAERIAFERSVVYTAQLLENLNNQTAAKTKAQEEKNRLQQKNEDLRKEKKILQDKYNAVQRQKQSIEADREKLIRDIETIRASKTYKLGSLFTYIPGQMKEVLRHTKSTSEITVDTNAQHEKEKETIPDTSVFTSEDTKQKSLLSMDRAPEQEANRAEIFLLGTPDYGNLGDQCITIAEQSFLKEFFPGRSVHTFTEKELENNKYIQLSDISPSCPVFLQGGGNLGSLWPQHDRIRGEIIKRLPRNPIIILSQSIWFSEDEEGQAALNFAKEIYRGKRLLLCCREKASYDFAKSNFQCASILVPDMVMWGQGLPRYQAERFGALTLFRRDNERKITDEESGRAEAILANRFLSVEAADTVVPKSPDWIEEIEKLLYQISSVECVFTDRLHGMILCAITGTPCVAIGNSYYKVEGCYEWLKNLSYIRLIHHTEELEQAIEKVVTCTERTYPQETIQQHFSSLIEYIRRVDNVHEYQDI